MLMLMAEQSKMNRQNVIVVIAPTLEVWGNFKKLCINKNLPYHSLKSKKFPIFYKDFVINKVFFL